MLSQYHHRGARRYHRRDVGEDELAALLAFDPDARQRWLKNAEMRKLLERYPDLAQQISELDRPQEAREKTAPATLPQQERDALAIATASDAQIQDLCLSMGEDPGEVVLDTRRILTQALVRYGETIDVDARKPLDTGKRPSPPPGQDLEGVARRAELLRIDRFLQGRRKKREPWA